MGTVTRWSSFKMVQNLCLEQLEIYEMIGQAISNSRRAGGEVSTGFQCYSRTVKE